MTVHHASKVSDVHPMPSIILLTDESSSMIGGTKPDAKNTSGSTVINGKDRIEMTEFCSPSRAKKVRNIAREPSMATNPYQGKENNSAVQPIRAGPYLSLNQPDRTSATVHAVSIHCSGEEAGRSSRAHKKLWERQRR